MGEYVARLVNGGCIRCHCEMTVDANSVEAPTCGGCLYELEFPDKVTWEPLVKEGRTAWERAL